MKDYKDRNNFILRLPFGNASFPCLGLKSAPQKVNIVMAKAISKSYTLDCSCKFPYTFLHSYA